MTVETNQPGLQLSTGNAHDGSPAHAGLGPRQALCLEAQRLPDSPNHSAFPSAILRPGEGSGA